MVRSAATLCAALALLCRTCEARNVLYIVFDDLRPDLSAYDVPFMETPHMQKLADTGTLFERAYCQIAVCSPSRNSFSTGRYPNTTKVWNFIDHFRNAACPDLRNTRSIVGTRMAGGSGGGHAQCCTSCSTTPGCAGFTYRAGFTNHTKPNGCALFSSVDSYENCPTGQPLESRQTCVSGSRGAFPQWTPLPAHFKNNGYLVLGSGKYYHPGGHSTGVAGDPLHPGGAGTPPLADREASWTAAGPNGTIQFPDQRIYAAKWGKFHSGDVGAPYGNFQYLNPDDMPCGKENPGYSDFCNPPWPADGTPPAPPAGSLPPANQTALGDFVTYHDAITKLRFAAGNLAATGQPFFQVMGIKRPHLNWRAPQAYLDKYPIESVAAPAQMTMDSSIDPVAYTVFPMAAPNCTAPGTSSGGGMAAGTAAAAAGIAATYTEAKGVNCFAGHGGINIDGSGNATTKTLPDCEAFCDATANCFCVVTKATSAKAALCYRRVSCDPAAGANSTSLSTYTKPGAPPSPAPPAPTCKNFVKDPYHAGSDAQVRILRQHYYAAVSWADFCAGKILDELASLKLENETMVVLHSDHGWHLGEYAMWEKRTNWELGTRVPLIMRVPWLAATAAGKRSRALVELVDIYKTVSEVMGLPLPVNDTHPIDGASLAPIFADPERATVKDAALSSFPRCAHAGMPVYGARGQPGGADNSCLQVENTDFTWMGYTMRTDRWRYTEWVAWNGTTLSPCAAGGSGGSGSGGSGSGGSGASGASGAPCTWGKLRAAELYDHLGDDKPWTDADKFENVNLVTTTDAGTVAALSKQLHAAFGYPDPE